MPKQYSPSGKKYSPLTERSITYLSGNSFKSTKVDELIYHENIKFWIKNYNRETEISTYIDVIANARPNYEYDWSGSLGFAPYTGMG